MAITEEQIKRINELYHKSKETGLSDTEKEEQMLLRQEYLASIRKNMRGTLENVSLVDKDGTVTPLSKKDKK